MRGWQHPGVRRAPCYAQQNPLLGRLRDALASSMGWGWGGLQGQKPREDTGKATTKDWSCQRLRLCLECDSPLNRTTIAFPVLTGKVFSFLVIIFKNSNRCFQKFPSASCPCPITPDPHLQAQGWLPIRELA